MLTNEWMTVEIGDQVALMPERESLPADVLEIQTVDRVRDGYIRFADCRMFAAFGGRALNTRGFIVRATDHHRHVIKNRRPWPSTLS